MKRGAAFFGLLAFACGLSAFAQKAIEIKTVDGVPHVLNPLEPLHGRVVLELEKTREIDPYKAPDVAMRMIMAERADDGRVVLYDPNKPEAHRFSASGAYLGRLYERGQGPGEFNQAEVVFRDGAFLATDFFGKIAKFDSNGRFLGERRIERSLDLLIAEDLYLSQGNSADARQISLVRLPAKDQSAAPPIPLFEARETWMHREPNGKRGFANVWVTPNILTAYNPAGKEIAIALNKTYAIQIRDLAGKLLRVIEKAHRPVKLSRADKEKMTGYQGQADNWKIDVCPDVMVALGAIEPMPGGNLAAYRYTGFNQEEIDVFDSEGRFTHVLSLPAGIELHSGFFFEGGIAGTVYGGDSPRYVEFRIKNLPEIFR